MTNSVSPSENPEPIDIRLRAFLETKLDSAERPENLRPGSYVLTFDCETKTDASQRLRFGAYRLDDLSLKDSGETLLREGLFYDEGAMDDDEVSLLFSYAKDHKLPEPVLFEAFAEEVLFQWCYELSGTIVGFNLPFDLSRLALDVNQARARGRDRRFKDGFTFTLSRNEDRPKLRIKHIDRRRAFMAFHYERGSVYPGHLVDVKTLGASLLSGVSSLASLADLLKTKTRKTQAETHGGKLTSEYIDYARNDVQCTFECYQALIDRLATHELADLRPMDVFSEASIGKAYLRSMGIKPWRQTGNVFAPKLIGHIMSSYYGGRSEVRIRREVREVAYTDFLSMYPTVNTLQGLWKFLIAEETIADESDAATRKARSFLEQVTPEDMLRQDNWKNLTALVQVEPDNDLLPIRAAFGESKSTNIGINYLSSETPLWYTLADCVAAKLLTGKTPKVIKAIWFSPGKPQAGLHKKKILGLENGVIDPREDDFFKRLIELRQGIKLKMNNATGEQRDRLSTEQATLKIIANATSYGHLIEMTPDTESEKSTKQAFGFEDAPHTVETNVVEALGEFFHPLLATLITGAARLMLALAERKAQDEGLIWSFCDTDGLALAKPKDMARDEFHERVNRVVDWFKPLNPYSGQERRSILQFEDENYSLTNRGELEPLYCYAVSAKRYALINIKDGKVLIRKASAHGLGFWRAPFEAPGETPDTGTPYWQSELWRLICQAAIEGTDSDGFSLSADERFSGVAAGQTTISKWQFYKWFDKFNEGLDYRDSVQPFNFLLRFPTKKWSEIETADPEFAPWCENNSGEPRLVAPFDTDTDQAAKWAFHRDAKAGDIDADLDFTPWLTSFADVFTDYDLHGEAKFINGQGLHSGELQRRHVHVDRILLVGKESHEWEENEALGLRDDPEIYYGEALPSEEIMQRIVRQALQDGVISSNALASEARVSKTTVRDVRNGSVRLGRRSVEKMYRVVMLVRTAGRSNSL